MKSTDLLIAAIWVLFLTDAYLQGLGLPQTQLFTDAMPRETVLIILVFPFAFFLPAAFLQRRIVLEIPIARRYVDAKYGPGAHRAFMVRLKPILLFTLGCGTLGLTGIVSTYNSTQSLQGFVMSGFFLSGSIGLGLAYILSIFFPPRLC